MTYRQAFAILQISSHASRDEIRSAYRSQARLYHPDHNPGSDGQRMSAVNEAYEMALRWCGIWDDPIKVLDTYVKYAQAWEWAKAHQP